MDTNPSRHEQYLLDLAAAGKSPADLSRSWHRYYAQLSAEQQLEVWRDYHRAIEHPAPWQQQPAAVPPPLGHMLAATGAGPLQKTLPEQPYSSPFRPRAASGVPTAAVPEAGADSAESVRPSRLRRNLQSLAFGAATSLLVTCVFLFSFFNEVFLSPFIQPSRTAAETPVIVDPASAAVGNTPKVIIPKINVEIPVDYSVQSTNNADIEAALDNGIVHYPTTVKPGQAGNAAFFGHSSNNIFNPGKYKFAFVLLHKLVEGDTFYITNEGKTYAYQVISRRVVEPTEVGVLGPVPNQTATATLITCDPPGTSLKRLVVVGRQISPDPAGNTVPATPPAAAVKAEPSESLPGNGPTLWSRIWKSVF